MTSSARTGGPEPESGLFVIWPDAASVESRILSTIDEDLEIRRVLRVRWTPERIDENFARFYRGQVAPPYSDVFSAQKGRGAFTVVIVTDPAPRYEMRDTTRGTAYVNANLLDAKQRFRAWTGGGMRVHGTDTAAEAIRDSLLLLGESPASRPDDASGRWDGTVEIVERDLTGSHGWSSLRELFEVLNHSITYLVLRNFEGLPNDFELGDHADVDLLTDDYAELIRLLHARPMLGRVPRWGGRFLVRVDGDDVVFDLRFVGDHYYDTRWARRLLDHRRLMSDAFFAPSDEDYFESLAYHAVVHKRHVADDYRDRLAQMAHALGRRGWERSGLDEPGRMATLVRTIVEQRGYEYVRPRDPTVFFNYEGAGASHPWLRRKLAGVRRESLVRGTMMVSPLTRAYGVTRRALVARVPWLRGLRGQLSRSSVARRKHAGAAAAGK